MSDRPRTPRPAYGPDRPGILGDGTRRAAIESIERRRRFHVELAASTLAILVLVIVWAASEYHNAGGWPSRGFSQSSGVHDVWNFWIVYPVFVILLVLGARAWLVYARRPISDNDIDREIERQRRS